MRDTFEKDYAIRVRQAQVETIRKEMQMLASMIADYEQQRYRINRSLAIVRGRMKVCQQVIKEKTELERVS